MSWMQDVRDGRLRKRDGMPTGLKVFAAGWICLWLGLVGTVIWVVVHFICKFW